VSQGMYAADIIPKHYADALRMGLLFVLVRRSGEVGVARQTLARALLWLEDARHAAAALEGAALADFERVRASDALLTQGSSDTNKLLEALENEKAITVDTKGVVRQRSASAAPNWLPQTPTLAKLASVMQHGLEQAKPLASATPAGGKAVTRKAKRA